MAKAIKLIPACLMCIGLITGIVYMLKVLF